MQMLVPMFKSISTPFSDRFRWLENKTSIYLCLEEGLYFYPSDKLFRWVRTSKIDTSKSLSSGCLGRSYISVYVKTMNAIVLQVFWRVWMLTETTNSLIWMFKSWPSRIFWWWTQDTCTSPNYCGDCIVS